MEKICIVKRRSSISSGLRQSRAFMPVNNQEVYGGTDYEFENIADGESDNLSLNLTPEQSELMQSNEHLNSFVDHDTKTFVLNMNNVDACNQLGSVYKSDENYAEASEAYKKVLSLNPFQEEAHMALVEAQYFQYRSKFNGVKKDEVMQRLDYLLAINPDNGKGKKLLKELIEDD